MPVSLARGTIDLNFDLNIHAFYSIDIGRSYGGNLVYGNGGGLRTRRISSVGELPVYRYQWVEDNSRSLGLGAEVIVGDFLGGFEGRRGHYHLRIEVLSDTACLDALNPRLYILASSQDFIRWYRYYLNGLWISFVSGSIGLGILIVGIRARLRNRSTEECNLPLFESRQSKSYAGRPRQRVAPWIPFFSQFGLLYSYILLLIVIPAILIFGYAWGYGQLRYGLYVLTDLSPLVKSRSCGEARTVRIDKKETWYLNSTKTSSQELPELIRQQLGGQSQCVVYLDVDPSLNYAVAVHAIDVIQTTQAKAVVLLTPRTRKLATE